MSGKKASEVNSLLRNGEQTRSASMDILNDALKNARNASYKLNKKAEESKKTVKDIDFSIPSETSSEFPDAAEKLKKECAAFLKEFDSDSYSVDLDEGKYDRILAKYKNTDDKADKIRKEISAKIRSSGQSDPWYCDDEYKRAGKVEQEYRSLASEVNSIRGEYTSLKTKAANLEAVLSSRTEKALKLRKSVDELNKKAKEAIETRKHAQSSRDSVKSEIGVIDKAIAEKFMASEYQNLLREADNYYKLSDNEVIKGYNAFSQKISIYKNELDKVYNAYLERRSKVKAMMDDISEKLGNRIFTEPEDEFKPESKRGSKMTLSEFMTKTGETECCSSISSAFDSVCSMFDSDDFDGAERSISEINDMIESSLSKAVLMHQNMKKTIYNMLSIRKVMQKMKYDVKVTKNGDFIKDGYRIECTAGDEVINYDRVAVVDEGVPVIDIDHKESVKGTCHAKWTDIRSELSGEGLIIEDITKNGHSIFGTPPAQANPDSGTVLAK